MSSQEISREHLIDSVTIANGKTTSGKLNITGYSMATMELPGGGLLGDLRYKVACMNTAIGNHKFLHGDAAALIQVPTAAQRTDFPRNLAVRPEAMIAASLAINMTTATTAEKTIHIFANG